MQLLPCLRGGPERLSYLLKVTQQAKGPVLSHPAISSSYRVECAYPSSCPATAISPGTACMITDAL